MSDIRISLFSRMRAFVASLHYKNLLARRIVLNILGWAISLLIYAVRFSLPFGPGDGIFLLAHVIFLYRLVGDIFRFLRPPEEFLLIIFQILLLLLRLLLGAVDHGTLIDPSMTADFFQVVLLGLLGLIFSILIVQNNNGKRNTLIWYAILVIAGHNFFLDNRPYLIFLYQVILFFSLIQKTTWLEEISKIECWLYWILGIFFFSQIAKANPFSDYSIQTFSQAELWYSYPYFLYLISKLYLLAIAVKIPIVLIYNHAPLARKLKISGLFQSTFPQLIQFVLLIVIFYIFISGFQARNLRKVIENQMTKIEAGSREQSLTIYQIDAGQKLIRIEDYQPLSLDDLENTTVIMLQHSKVSSRPDSQKSDYFLFFESATTGKNIRYVVKIDSLWLKSLAEPLRYLAGSTLQTFVLTPGRWTGHLYRSDFLSGGDFDLRIFPFAFVPPDSNGGLSVVLDPGQKEEHGQSWLNMDFLENRKFVLGRVFLPVHNPGAEPDRIWLLDIVLESKSGAIESAMSQVILFLILLYVLLNSIVIQRVIKFGEQINRMIVQKFSQLKSGINEIAAGNLEYKIKIEGEDEFVELADRFNQMGEELKQNIAEAQEKERLKYELHVAREVQLSLLPPQLPDIPGYQTAASLETANEVGGDFYDIFPLDQNRYLFTIGDVSGKGASAAFYMAQCISLIRYSRQFTSDPAEIGSRLNDYFATNVADRQIFVTTIIGVLDTAAHVLRFIRAGHMEPILISGLPATKIKILRIRGLGIGLTHNTALFEKSLRLFQITFNPGDTLVCYTDGVIEAARPLMTPMEITSGKENFAIFGEERLLELLKKCPGQSAPELVKSIDRDLQLFYSDQPRIDDHTLLVIQRVT